MFKIAICDDNLAACNTIEDFIYKIKPCNIECDVYQDGQELVYAYEKNKERYDIIFLDIEMNELDGIKAAALIREMDEHVIIVFITNHSKYMKDSFKCLPFRFIEKPIQFDEFREVFNDASKKLSKKRKTLAFTENKTKIRLYCDDIIYCESQAHWIKIHTKDHTYKICKSMPALLDMLDRDILYRTHNSYIINFKYVKSIDGNEVELYHCDEKIPISRQYKKNIITEFTNFTERELYV